MCALPWDRNEFCNECHHGTSIEFKYNPLVPLAPAAPDGRAPTRGPSLLRLPRADLLRALPRERIAQVGRNPPSIGEHSD